MSFGTSLHRSRLRRWWRLWLVARNTTHLGVVAASSHERLLPVFSCQLFFLYNALGNYNSLTRLYAALGSRNQWPFSQETTTDMSTFSHRRDRGLVIHCCKIEFLLGSVNHPSTMHAADVMFVLAATTWGEARCSRKVESLQWQHVVR